MLIVVLVVDVIQFIVRIMMIPAISQSLDMLLGVSTCQVVVELFMLLTIFYMLANDIKIIARPESSSVIAGAISAGILSQCGKGARK